MQSIDRKIEQKTAWEDINTPNKTLAPGQLQGYLLQIRHMLHELICLDERVVSVEALDDVAVQICNKVVAEQLKSVTSENNPVTDRSTVFWKALYNWCISIEQGFLPHDATLRFVVVASSTITSGDIPTLFENAKTDEDAQEALRQAKAVILARTPLPDSYREYVQYLFDDSRKAVVCQIIKSLEIKIHNATYDEDLLKLFGTQAMPPGYEGLLLSHMLGWVLQKVDSCIKNHEPAYISATEYRRAFSADVGACNFRNILQTISAAPTPSQVAGEVKQLDTYIKQLKLIEADEDELLEAANDFLWMKKEKTEWAEQLIVTSHSFHDYNEALYRIWKSHRDLESARVPEYPNPVKCGKAVYAQCKLTSVTLPLQGVPTPNFFGSGSLHDLANNPVDSPRIGWHPQYKELLKVHKQ